MNGPADGFVLQTSPHAHSGATTPRTMYVVVASLVPVVVVSVLYFGPGTLLLYLVSLVSCLATEIITKVVRRHDWRSIRDGSAVVTALLLVMVLPPGISPIIVGLGGGVSIFIGKEVFGGLGQNIFNPALVGRAFLSAAYPVKMTTWAAPREVFGFLPPATTLGLDTLSGATPLAAAKFDGASESLLRLLFGEVSGSIGDTSVLFVAAGGSLLLALGIARWQMVLSFLGTIFAGTAIFWLIDPGTYASPVFHILAGGAVLGAFYMATDMVTTPYTVKGTIIFGVGAGVLTVVIRLFGGFPEGVMYAILLMNAATPIINRFVENRVFGAGRRNRVPES